MDSDDPSASVENEQQFWTQLHDLVSGECDTHEAIDDVLRQYLSFTATLKYDYLDTEYDLSRCCYELLDSTLFIRNREYVRRQFIYGILQEDESPTLHIMASFLLFDGRSEEETFQMMQQEGVFTRLLELIKSPEYDGTNLHKMLLELMCEMSCIQQLSHDDMKMVDDEFILYLFQRIEELSNDASDPYHSAIIRILLVFNEQYMCFAQEAEMAKANRDKPTLANRIINILSTHGPAYRTFGENLILLLNRENSLGPQLLILKLLYLLFTTPSTYEYFYTNDLHVLVDVIIRNLLDLDPGYDDDDSTIPTVEGGGQKALRHTYLRVLHPLLRNTQLSQEGSHYKREDLRRLLQILVHKSSLHFAPVDATIVRLVTRCRQVEWIRDESDELAEIEVRAQASPMTEGDVAKKMLGMNLLEGGESKLSIIDVAAKVEREEKKKPIVPPPRRRNKRAAQLDSQRSSTSLRIPPVTPRAPSSDSGTPLEKSPFSDDERNDD